MVHDGLVGSGGGLMVRSGVSGGMVWVFKGLGFSRVWSFRGLGGFGSLCFFSVAGDPIAFKVVVFLRPPRVMKDIFGP